MGKAGPCLGGRALPAPRSGMKFRIHLPFHLPWVPCGSFSHLSGCIPLFRKKAEMLRSSSETCTEPCTKTNQSASEKTMPGRSGAAQSRGTELFSTNSREFTPMITTIRVDWRKFADSFCTLRVPRPAGPKLTNVNISCIIQSDPRGSELRIFRRPCGTGCTYLGYLSTNLPRFGSCF